MLTKPQQHKRKRLLAKIHMSAECKSLKNMDAWEDWVYVRYGVESCKHLSITELEKVADELLKGIVFKECEPDIQGRALLKEINITSKQLFYMKELWRENSKNKDETSLLRFTKKVLKKQYLHLELMDSEEATKVITVLEKKL